MLKPVGRVRVVVWGADGRIKHNEEVHNVVTNVGKAQIAGLINGLVTSSFTYIAIGTGTATATETDTALASEIARKQGTASQVTTTVTNDTAQVQVTFSSADGLSGVTTVAETGLFDAASAGNMLARTTINAVADWDAGDTLQITWKIQVT